MTGDMQDEIVRALPSRGILQRAYLLGAASTHLNDAQIGWRRPLGSYIETIAVTISIRIGLGRCT